MTPSEFTFKLTVPNDPEGVQVVAAMTVHTVEYATLEAAVGAAFVERVRAHLAAIFNSKTGTPCLVVFAAANGQLTVTVGGQSISQPLPA
jgi:hypothetical protein